MRTTPGRTTEEDRQRANGAVDHVISVYSRWDPTTTSEPVLTVGKVACQLGLDLETNVRRLRSARRSLVRSRLEKAFRDGILERSLTIDRDREVIAYNPVDKL